MCNPFAIGAVVAGVALQQNAQSRRQAAMKNAADDAQNAELLRQDAFKKDSAAALDPAMQNATRATQDAALADAAAKREAAYSDASTLPGDQGTADYQAPSEGATYGQPKIIQDEADKVRSKNNAELSSVGNARARLASYGDVGLGNSILNQNAGNTINMLGNFSKQSSALLPGEIQAAMAKKAGTAKNQELLGSALQMYGTFGAPGMGAGAAAAGAGAGGATGAYGAALNSGAANTVGAVAPSAGGAALGSSMAQSAFPLAAQSSVGGLGGLLGQIQPWWQQTAGGVGSLLAQRR